MLVIIAELKRVGKEPTAEQQHWLDVFGLMARVLNPLAGMTGIRFVVKVWTPADWKSIEETFDQEG